MEVLVRDELLARLGGRVALDRALGQGTWQRVFRGTYARGEVADDLSLRAAAAHRLLPTRSLVADRCLLWLLGVDVLPPGPSVLEVVVPREAVVPRRAGVRARSAALPVADRRMLGRLPVLRPARAVGDLLCRLPLAEAVVVADAVQHAGLVSRPEIALQFDAHVGLRGVQQARRVLDLSDARAESPPESRVRLLLVLGGLDPTPQLEVFDDEDRWLARVDLGFKAARVAVEFDGREVHLQGAAFVTERRRQNALLAAGWLVLRYTAGDLRDRPAAILAEVRAALCLRCSS